MITEVITKLNLFLLLEKEFFSGERLFEISFFGCILYNELESHELIAGCFTTSDRDL
jgi:hypothetical protein